jgi:hypothetical protein
MLTSMHVLPAPALSSAVRGMSDASRRMDTGAQNVADDSPDLVTDLVEATVVAPVEATVVAPAAYTANATVARTAAETERTLLDIRA